MYNKTLPDTDPGMCCKKKLENAVIYKLNKAVPRQMPADLKEN